MPPLRPTAPAPPPTRSVEGLLRPSRTLRLGAIALIVTAAPACDNVSWGGIDVRMERLEPPPSAAAPKPEEESEVLPTLPEGEVVYLGRIVPGQEPALIALAEVAPDGSLRPLSTDAEQPGFNAYYAEQRLAPNREFVAFLDGARVGTFVAGGETFVDTSLCRPRPAARGVFELTAAAGNARRFIAFAKSGFDTPPPHGAPSTPASFRDDRVASLNIAGSVITREGALWPPDLVEARRDFRLVGLPGADSASIVATFLFRDAFNTGPAPARAWSMLIIGQDRGAGYEAAYVWFQDYDRDGKAAPRFLTKADLDRDGRDEVILEVFGTDARWIAILGERDGVWTRVYQDDCGGVG